LAAPRAVCPLQRWVLRAVITAMVGMRKHGFFEPVACRQARRTGQPCVRGVHGRVSYHQASASWSAGGRPCRPAVPTCVAIVGKGPWSCEQRLRAVISQAVRSGALFARHGAMLRSLRYPWALGTCSPLVRVMFAILHPTCAPAPTLSVLALPWPRCDLHCARV
jgi:hypothetical protein